MLVGEAQQGFERGAERVGPAHGARTCAPERDVGERAFEARMGVPSVVAGRVVVGWVVAGRPRAFLAGADQGRC